MLEKRKMKKLGLVTSAILLTTLSGCSSVNNSMANKQKSVELYRVFDIKTDGNRDIVIEAASDGLGANVGSANEQRPIVMGEKPAKPGRFKPTSAANNMGHANGMMKFAMSMNPTLGNMLKTAACDGAVWTATAQKNADNAFNMSFNLCLWEYQGGYALDVYANYTKQEGGGLLGIDNLTRSAAYALVGTPEEWAEKTVLDVVREIKQEAGGTVQYIEGYPKLDSTPWLDSGEVFNKEGFLSPAIVAN